MTNTCESCRFFGTELGVYVYDEEHENETKHHLCARIIHGNATPQPPGVARELAVVTDGSGYAARLRVLPTFGCLLHEARNG